MRLREAMDLVANCLLGKSFLMHDLVVRGHSFGRFD